MTNQDSYAVASQVQAKGNINLHAEQDISIQGSIVSAGQNLELDSGRNLTISAVQNQQDSSHWSYQRETGVAISTDANGYSAFVGNDKRLGNSEHTTQTAVASVLYSGQDITARAGGDIMQIGSDVVATRDIDLQAGGHIQIRAAEETHHQTQQNIHQRSGLTVNISHNFDNTKNALKDVGQGDDALSRVSNTLKAADSVTQFVSGPTNSMHMGNKQQTQTSKNGTQTYRASIQQAGGDLTLQAGQDIQITGSQQQAQRNIHIAGQTIHIDVAQGGHYAQSEQTTRQSGLTSAASVSNARAGVGASYGTHTSESEFTLSQTSTLEAGGNIDIIAAHDLLLRGTQVQARRDIGLKAGNDLSIFAAQNDSQHSTHRHSGGSEIGATLGTEDGIALYASVDYGRGNLDRQAAKQLNANIHAGGNIALSSDQDTHIAGAYIEGQNIQANIGRNLHIASTQDTGHVSGKEVDISANVSIGYGGSGNVSASAGFGKTSGKTDWIDQQTALIAKDSLNIRTENHTQLDAALIASQTGSLTLDTNTLGYSDHKGVDREHGWYLNAGGSWSASSSNKQNSAAASSDQNQNSGNFNNLSGHDYRKERRQNMLATIGQGQIIVRSDQTTGHDSTTGINRDTDQAAQITRDYEKNTQIYLSKSSIESLQNPEQTWEMWKSQLGSYGVNNAFAFQKMSLLAEEATKDNNKIKNLFGWTTKSFITSTDVMDTVTLGVFAGVGNHGGLYTQIPVLFTGDLQLMRAIVNVKKDDDANVRFDENGKTILDTVEVDEFDGKYNKEEKIGINGINNNMELAAKNAAEQSGAIDDGKGVILPYNPTHGMLGDLIESGIDTLFMKLGSKSVTGTARNFNNFLKEVSQNSTINDLTIVGHSQGGLLLKQALPGVKFNPEIYNGNLRIQFSGAPIDAKEAHKVAKDAGFNNEKNRVFQVNRPEETTIAGYPKTDFVPDILGGNYQYSENPSAYRKGGWLSGFRLFTDKSPHSNYSCSVCVQAKDQTTDKNPNNQIRNKFINPTLIDEYGNFHKRDK